MSTTTIPPRLGQAPAGPVRAAAWPVLAAAAAAAVASALVVPALARTGPLVTLSLLGYVLGALATSVLAVVHRWKSRTIRTNPRRVVVAWHPRLVTAALALGIAAGMVHAWLLATELARR
jgi:hypothetical protein